MPLLTSTIYGTVHGMFLRGVAGTPTVPEEIPDGLPVTDLRVEFTPSISPPVVRDVTATPPVSIVVQPVTATIDAAGRLIGPDGNPGVTLVASTHPDLQPWTWRVSLSSPTLPRVSFSFALDAGADVDLATVVRVPADPGSTLEQWLQVVAAAEAARDAAIAARDAVSARIDAILESAPGNLDSFFEAATRFGLDEATVTALQTLVAAKAPLASPTFTGQVGGITAAMIGGLGTAATHPATDFDPAGAAAGVTLAALGGVTPAGATAAAASVAAPIIELPSSLPAGTSLAHRSDPIHQAYNVTADSMRLWNAGKARMQAGGAAARVLCLGHSVVVGTGDSSPRWQYGFATKLRNLFNAKYGSAGTGIVHLVTTALTDDSRISFTGTWTAALGTRGAFNAGCYNATGTGNTIVFTPDVPVDSFNVYYVRNAASGTFSMQVDSGIAGTANANKTAPEDIQVATISAGTLGMHTLTITPPAAQQGYFVAVEGVVGSSGVRVTRCGRAGANTGTITQSGSGTGVDSLGTIFNPISAPDLTVIMCEINDYLNGVSVATFTANLTTLVQRAQASGSVLVVVDETVMTQPNATSGLYQSAYHAAIYGLADSLGFGVFDVATRWKDYATSSAAKPGLYANATADPSGVHPSAIGHQDIANGLFSITAGDYSASSSSSSGVFLPEWQANTAYTAGQYVLNPSGQIVSANSSFTSGSSYSAANWTAVSSGSSSGSGLPSDASIAGFNAWSYDIAAAAGTAVISNLRFIACRMMASGGTISNLHLGVTTAAVGPAANVKMGLFDATGNLLGTTADIGALLTSTGYKTFPLVTPAAVTPGQIIYVGFWWSGTTGPSIVRGNSPATISNQFAVGPVRFGFIQGLSILPSSFNPASLGTENVDYWLAAS